MNRVVMGVVAGSLLALSYGASAEEAASAGRQLIKLADGENTTLFGGGYRARGTTMALVSLSSELVTVAIVSGELGQGKLVARAGQALVTPIDGTATRLFGYDAARLAATIPPQWAGDAAAPLAQLAAAQKRAKFWGLVEPAGINAAAPTSPQVEAVRQSYLGNATVVALRQAAQGNPQTLAGLTATRFAEALAAGNAAAVADLIDPKPFTDTGADAGAWQAARLSFAQKLTGDATLKAAMAAVPAAAAAAPGAFDVAGAFRIQLVARDRAMFVATVEPLS